MTSIVEIINHYQKSIDKSLDDEARLVHCIGKLYRLPISVQHLQETGIGRTVNGLRKYDGEVGIAAKALVTKWKTMVAEEESEDGAEQPENPEAHDGSGHGDGDEGEDNYDDMRLQVDEHQDSGQEQQAEESDDPDDEMNGHESDDRSGRNVSEYVQHETPSEHHRSDRSAREHHSSGSSSGSGSSKRNREDRHRSSSSKESKSRDRHDKDRFESKEGKSSSSRSHSSSSSSMRSSSHGEKEKKDRYNSTANTSSSSSRRESSQSNGKESSHSSSKVKKISNDKHHSSSKESKKSLNGYTKDGDSSNKRSRASEDETESHSKKIKKEPSEKNRSSSSSSSSKDKSSSSKSSSSGSNKEKEKKMSDKKKDSSPKKKRPQSDHSDEEVEGLDSSAGASFADALAMIGMPSSSKKKSSTKISVDRIKKASTSMPPPAAKAKLDSSTSSSSSSKSSRSRESSSPCSTASSSGYSSCSSTPSLLVQQVKLEPLPEVAEIVESLPVISPHYKPMPLNQTVMECVFSSSDKPRKNQSLNFTTEEEMFGHSMQSKNIRTKVYSGVKNTKAGVPSLYDLCIRLLQENIDLIDCTGGIPFDLLKPVLERATPNQLFNLEEYNPYLMEDTDLLWEQHCKRIFRSQKRKEEDCESWREMYIRCSEERESKLRSLTQNIKQAQVEKTAPLRKTQLAYVDSAVKPPRNVISKQAKYGTDRTPVVSPAARVASLKNATSNVTKAGDSRLKVSPGARDNAQVQVFHPGKPKKAPLMAKLMTSIKGFKTGFRR